MAHLHEVRLAGGVLLLDQGDRIRAVRNAVGSDIRIRIDVNRAWDPATALDRLSAIERFGVEYVEAECTLSA